jgi:hypothetical protein
MPPPSQRPVSAFYALQPSWFTLDKFYKVYVHRQGLYAALLARQVFDEDSAFMQLVAPAQFLAPLAQLWADRLLANRREQEQRYNEMDPTSQEFLRGSRHNFWIPFKDIVRVELERRKASLWMGGRAVSGVLWLVLRDLKTRRFILVHKQDVDVIRSTFEPASGDSSPITWSER